MSPFLSTAGATPSQYGLVFGIANLAAFLSAPIFGRYGAKIGPKFLYNFGAFMQALCCLAFGFLDFIPNVGVFLGLSYCLR
jgi:MFS family permease